MGKYTSKTGNVNKSSKLIYNFLTDLNNLKDVVPQDKVKDFEATVDTCKFNIEGIGQVGLKIIEKEPHKLIKISSDGKSPFSFFFWIQLKPIKDSENNTAIRLTIDANLNPMMKMMVGKQLQKGIDAIVDQLVVFFNEKLKGE
ncbi:MAG: SRPBCC domain-containing protein [Bacteroidales bacterium]|jgi:carbon monoxide dehydrogenase subunit G|nr:SRPBCC domain-containing protein [Bacteroidales bacterium]